MSEYRRFIAYFYEYIDTRKQGNAGFVKVELRDGLWRFFLRLTVGACPVPPIRVYGFVREQGNLLGLTLGTIRPVQQIAEEWAFREKALIGKGSHTFGDLAGLWIESGDGRRFITVWDEEEIEVERFVTEAEIAEREAEEDKSVPDEKKEAESVLPELKEVPVIEAAETEPEEEKSAPDGKRAEGAEADEVEPEDAPSVEVVREDSNIVEQLPDEKEKVEAEENEAEENETKEDMEEENTTERSTAERSTTEKNAVPRMPEPGSMILEELFQKRAAFQPFAGGAGFESCVMILPCDIARLQQENWNIGRSIFLQHGFYQYRHLLLGKAGDGTYILGVPGIDNPQEEYMAQMFGYEWFRESQRRDGGQIFGYWCRALRKM